MNIKKILFLFMFFLFVRLLSAGSLYIDNFNSGASPNLLGGPYAYDVWGPGSPTASLSYESNTPFGNSGKSLKFTYTLNNAGDNAQVWMALYPDRTVNLSNYQYLSFRVKASSPDCPFIIFFKDSSGGTSSMNCNVNNFIPGGKLATSYQKVTIPLTAMRYDTFNAGKVTNIYFFFKGTLKLGTGEITIDEIVLANGAGPVYVDNMEVIESPIDHSALGYNIYSNGDNDPTSFYSSTQTVTNDKFLGTNAYCLRHITQIGSGWGAWAQSVWTLKGEGAELSPYIDISACNRLQFIAKKGSNKLSEQGRFIHIGNLAGNPRVGLIGLTPSWSPYDLALADFTGLDMNHVSDVKLVSEDNGGNTTNVTFIDEIRFVDSIPPQTPTNIRVNGWKLNNNSTLTQGILKITASVFSNEPLDKSLEAVFVEYRKNSGVWKTIGFDYNTDKKDFTNLWDLAGLTGTNNIDIRISSLDSSSNTSSKMFTGCSIVSLSPQSNSFNVSLSNVDVAGIIDFGYVSSNHIPKIARNSAGKFSFACINYNIHSFVSSWKIVVYTENTNASANPRYKGVGNLKYGERDDGTGLVGIGGGAGLSNSTPIKVWCDAKNSDGTFAKAPCDNWKGTALGLQGVPDPAWQGGSTNLYWKNQDLNGNGTNVNVIQTNAHWLESVYNYDANGDGDFSDSSTGTSGDRLGRVYEWSCWMPVTSDDRVVPGANTAVMIDNTVNGSMSGSLKVYFAITDILTGIFKTNQLIFELVIN